MVSVVQFAMDPNFGNIVKGFYAVEHAGGIFH